MKKFLSEFFRRGMVAMGIGPLVLAVLYLVLRQHGAIGMLMVEEVCTGIVSLSALAFMAGGMNAVYQVERLPLMGAILLHGGVLYAGYLATYLLNGWLQQGMMPVLVFTGVFVVGYLAIWALIYAITSRRTARLNEMLKENQKKGTA